MVSIAVEQLSQSIQSSYMLRLVLSYATLSKNDILSKSNLCFLGFANGILVKGIYGM